MKEAGRVALAVIVGVLAWGLLWNVGTLGAQRALPELAAPGEPITHLGLLVALVAYSVLASLIAGWTAAALAPRRARTAMWALALVNLAIGIAVEISYWELMPAWYHVVFLALVMPATLAGGWLRQRKRANPWRPSACEP